MIYMFWAFCGYIEIDKYLISQNEMAVRQPNKSVVLLMQV